MAECWFYSRYLACHPEKWLAFYRRSPGMPKVKLPDEDGMIKDVIACNHPLAPSETARRMQKAWKAGSKGAHLTGEGMVQTASDDSSVYHVGPTFSPSMAFTTFAYGLLTTERLTRETMCLLRFDAKGAAETANALRENVEDAIERLESLQPKLDPSG